MSSKSRRRATCLVAIGAVTAMTLAGGSGSAWAEEPITGESLRIVLGSQPQASQIPLVYGVGHYGGDFGLAISVEQNVTKFDSHTDAVQTLLDGDAQVMATSFSAILDAREQGEDVKMFCPYVSMDDFVLAGANGVNTAGQLFEPSTRVGIDSPGGAGAIVLNAMLSGIGEPRDVDEIPNQQIIESSSARTAAWAAGETRRDGHSRHAVRRCRSNGEPTGADRHPLRECPGIHQGSSGRPSGLARTEPRTRRQILRHHAARDEGAEERLQPVPGGGRRIRRGATLRGITEGAVRAHRAGIRSGPMTAASPMTA